MRERHAAPVAESASGREAEVAEGVLQHLADDRWFHRTPAFVETSAEIAARYRSAVGADNGFRAGFLGHIATELLLDGVLIERNPRRVNAYYDALSRLDGEVIQRNVNRMAPKTTARLAAFISTFHQTRFLLDYVATDRLHYRLNQMVQRIGLAPLPRRAESVLQSGRRLVRERVGELLPPQWHGYTA